jgi:hypothetical protein
MRLPGIISNLFYPGLIPLKGARSTIKKPACFSDLPAETGEET